MPKKGTWLPAENFVISGVGKNYTKALKIATFHFNALTAQSGIHAIAALLVLFTPYYNLLLSSSVAKSSALGSRMADTQAKDELFLMLTQLKLPTWQQMIGNVYLPGSVGFKNLFPFGLDPFYKGTMENKLLALSTLSTKCSADPSLTAVASLISSFYTLIEGARTNQNGEKTSVETGISNQQAAIEAMCIQHFANYGAIVALYPALAKTIKSFIDWQTLQTHEHSPFYIGTVNANRKKMALKHDFTGLSTMKVSTDVDMTIWVTDSINNPSHPVGILVLAATPTVVRFPGLGNPANRIVQVQNMNLLTKGHYTIEIL